MEKKFFPVAGFLFLFISILLVSAIYLTQKSQKKSPASNAPVVTQKELLLTPTITPTPTIDWKTIRVPEMGEKAPDQDTAVPSEVSATSGSGKIRVFNITVKNDTFSPSRVIVNQGDTVRMYITATDKQYEVVIPSYGNDLTIPMGSTGLLEFQVPFPGQFAFQCKGCENQKFLFFFPLQTQGVLYVKPAS